MQLEIPFDSFAGIMNDTRPDTFDPQKLERITIFQGLDDGKSHTVYIDEITVADVMPTTARLLLLLPGVPQSAMIAISI